MTLGGKSTGKHGYLLFEHYSDDKMRPVDGQTLGQLLHDNDVLHDDLHPGNVLIAHSADRPVVKISDFGISQHLRGAAAVRPNVVHHAIMPPESCV